MGATNEVSVFEDPLLSSQLLAGNAIECEGVVKSPPECNEEEAKHWQYPSNYEKREYQFAMVEAALFRNTLVCLPTGLGKTLIAAVVMLNFYRWFPNGKIIFMAPTKPLVAQQIDACRDIVSIPASDSIVMTGKMSADTRAKHWTSKRIFFVTPQIPQNDIASGICPTDQICLLVFDEAHKAHGDYAYCDVVRHVSKRNPFFRVLALSATPGGDFASIQEVLTNLLISKIELRTEESPDVKPFLHTRFVEEISVKLEGPILRAKELLKALINVPITWLQTQQVLYRTKRGDNFTFTRLEAARTDFRMNANMQRKDEFWRSSVEARFSVAMAMYHGSRLITDYGLAPFKDWINAQTMKPLTEKTSRYFEETIKSREWMALSMFVNEDIGDAAACRHPKMNKLESIVLDHFDSYKSLTSPNALNIQGGQNLPSDAPSNDNAKAETRVMIFVQFRDTVEEIVALLKRHEPFIRPMAFVGQAKKGLSQKQQAEVVKQFREGHFNTLVSTSIGEEGLDIGEVDLIVCYDAQQSPIRMIQRMGRTGRKRNGRCVMLLTAGTEDISYKRSKTKSKAMIKAISSSTKFKFYNGAESNHLLPARVSHPTPIMVHMEPILDEEDTASHAASMTKAKKSAVRKENAAKRTAVSAKDYAMLLEEEDAAEQSEVPKRAAPRLVGGTKDWTNFEIEKESDEEPEEDETEVEDEKKPIEMDIDEQEVEEDYLESAAEMEILAKIEAEMKSRTASIRSKPNFNDEEVEEKIVEPPIPVQNPLPERETRMVSDLVPISSSIPNLDSKMIVPKATILDQSLSMGDNSESFHLPLDDFPPGFLDVPRRGPAIVIPPVPPILSSSTSSLNDNSCGMIPPPPEHHELAQQHSPISLPPPLTTLRLPGQASTRPKTQTFNTMTLHARQDFQNSSLEEVGSTGIQKPIFLSSSESHSASVLSTTDNHPSNDCIVLEKTDFKSTESRVQTELSKQSEADLSTSVLSQLDSMPSSSPISPKFKRLKRKPTESVESEEDACFSPPNAKRACSTISKPTSKPRRSRFLDEEASLDLDNSDGDASLFDERRSNNSVPNSQDIAFIADENSECDASMRGMRAVYAKSLSSPQKSRKEISVELAKKMAQWDDYGYSDVEENSDLDTSRRTHESIIEDESDARSENDEISPFSIVPENSKIGPKQNIGHERSDLKPNQPELIVIESPESSPRDANKNLSPFSPSLSKLALNTSKKNNTTLNRETPSNIATTTVSTMPVATNHLKFGPPKTGHVALGKSSSHRPSIITTSTPHSIFKHTTTQPTDTTTAQIAFQSTPSAAPPKRAVQTVDIVNLLEGLDPDELLACDFSS